MLIQNWYQTEKFCIKRILMQWLILRQFGKTIKNNCDNIIIIKSDKMP